MKRFVRFIAISLALLIACSVFSGCFGGTKKGPEKQVLDKVYRYVTTELVTIENPEYENPEDFNGQSYIGYSNVDSDGYIYTVQTIDKNYEPESLIAYIGSVDGAEPIAIPLNVQSVEDGYRNVQNFCRMPDGLLVGVHEHKVIDRENYINENNYYIEVYGLDGTLKNTVNIKDTLDISRDNSQYLGVNALAYAAGSVFATVSCEDVRYQNKLVRFSLDGKLEDIMDIIPEGSEGYINKISSLGENKLCIPYEIYGQQWKQTMLVLDLESGERTEVDAGDNYEIMYRSFVGADGNLYYSNEEGIYSFDTVSGEEKQLADFINSDYIYEYGSFCAVNSEKFLSLTEFYEDGKTSLKFTTFEKVPEEELTPKYIIKVASAGNAYNFRKQIIEFNLASEEYRIQYTDYSQYNTEEDYDAGKTKLNNDIIAGNIPDVLIADQEFSSAKYVNKGLFVDLYTFMDSDATLSRDKFLPNILSACEINGKLYEIPTNVYLTGFIGIKDKIADFGGLTMPEFVERVNALPEGVTFLREGDYSRNDLLRLFITVNYSDYINPTTGLCSLNSDDFKATLEWLATQPEKNMWEKEDFDYNNFDYEAYENIYKEGKAIANRCSLDNFNSFSNYSYTFGDSELDFIGLPAPDGDGMAFSTTNLKFLVSAKGNFPKEAWEFVKVFFTDENQRDLGWGFPVTMSALELEKQEILDIIAEREASEAENTSGDTATEDVILDNTLIGGSYIRPMYRNTTREDVEKIYGYVLSTKKEIRYDESILDIIWEEASEYFGGKKSIDEVALQAQSRVNIKLGEQY